MGKIILGTTISLDCYINDRNGSVVTLYPDLDTWRYSKPGRKSIQNTGAVVMERNSFTMAGDPDWYAGNYEYQVSCNFLIRHKSYAPHWGCFYFQEGLYCCTYAGHIKLMVIYQKGIHGYNYSVSI